MLYTKDLQASGALVKAVMTDVNGNTVSVEKGSIRNAIYQEGMDIEDLVADQGKMISLLITATGRLYSLLSDEQKAKLPENDKLIFDHVFDMFAVTQTWGDRQLAVEGTAMIDKIFARQDRIGEIVAENKGITE